MVTEVRLLKHIPIESMPVPQPPPEQVADVFTLLPNSVIMPVIMKLTLVSLC